MVHLWLLSRVFYNLIRAAFWRASNCTGVVFKSSWRRAVYWKACVQDSSELPTFFTFLKSRLLIGSITWYPVSLGRGSGCFELRLSLVCVLWWHTRCLANQPTNQESRAYSPWVTFVTCPALPAGQLRTPHNTTCTTWRLSICLSGGLFLFMLKIISINQRVNVFGDNQILSDLLL